MGGGDVEHHVHVGQEDIEVRPNTLGVAETRFHMHDCSDMMESVPEKPDYRVVTNRHRLALELAARVEMLRIIRELGATRTLGREVRDGAEAKTMLHTRTKNSSAIVSSGVVGKVVSHEPALVAEAL